MHTESHAASSAALYRRVWRWHFFAGLICLPFIFSLAATGALYLFQHEIDDIVYADLLLRPAAAQPGGAALAPERLVAIAQQAYPGQPRAIALPADARHNAQVDVRTSANVTLQVFVDPVSGRVAGGIDESSRLMTTIKHLHSMALVGDGGKAVIEVVAGWVIVLVLSGAYLWWPRGRRHGVVSIRPGAAGRAWWRDLHAVTGAFAAVFILFLALTGMPWSVFWGQQVNAWMSEHGLGVPEGMWRKLPKSSLPAAELGELPWSVQQLPVPASAGEADKMHTAHRAEEDPHAQHRAEAAAVAGVGASAPYAGKEAAVGADRIVATLRELDIAGGYRLVLPRDARGVYTAIRLPGRLDGQRVVHLDQYSGRVLMNVGAADMGAVSRVTEWGVSVHQGGEYGLPNQLLMLAACLATMALGVSGVVAWWRRRPPGKLAAPQRKADARLAPGVVAIAAGAGIVFPLLGASMLLAWLADTLLTRRRRAQ